MGREDGWMGGDEGSRGSMIRGGDGEEECQGS